MPETTTPLTETAITDEQIQAVPDNSDAQIAASNLKGIDVEKEDIANRADPEAINSDIGKEIDDFKAIKDGLEIFKPTKKEEPKEETTVEAKPDAEIKTNVEVKPEVKTQVTSNQKVARDLTGFDENEQKLLKSMSNDAFSYIRPQLLEKKKLGEILAAKDRELAALKSGKQLLPDNYYEHPNAFVLTPEFNSASNNMQLSQFIHEHWKKQLVNIRQGKDWEDLAITNGRPIKTAGQKATAEAEGEILGLINSSAVQYNKYQNDMQGIMTGFTSRHKEAVEVVKQAEKQYFSAFDDDKHPYAPVAKNIMTNIPAEFRSSPLASVLAKSVAASVMLNTSNTKLQAENAELKAKLAEIEKTSPNAISKRTTPTESDIRAAGQKSNGSNDKGAGTTIDDFKALRN
jgi:hypothetical protein